MYRNESEEEFRISYFEVQQVCENSMISFFKHLNISQTHLHLWPIVFFEDVLWHFSAAICQQHQHFITLSTLTLLGFLAELKINIDNEG